MRIALLCHYFHPEIGAPSARLHALAHDLQTLGHQVTVVTGFPNHPTGIIPPEYRGRWFARENLDGVIVLRSWIYATPNEGVVMKTIGHLSFMISSAILSSLRLGEVDILIVSSPTLFSVVSAWIISTTKKIPFVFEVRDLWPGIFVELGVIKNRLIIKALEALEMFLYHRAAAIVTVTESFRDNLVSRGIPTDKVSIITNGVNLEDFSPGTPNFHFRKELALENKFIVLYIGAHGISQSLSAVLATARIMSDRDDILFLFVGEGAEKQKLQMSAKQWKLENIRFLPGQPRDQVLSFYRLADVCLVPLRDIPLFDTFIPSKMFEIMGCAKPIVASVRGESARILEQSGAAIVVKPEDFRAMAEAIDILKANGTRRQAMGDAGRIFVEKHYQRRTLAEKYCSVLTRTVGLEG